MEQYLTVATFNEREPAERIAVRLREAGFKSDVFDESNAQRFLMMNLTPRAHMRVRVDKDDGERAIQLLNEWDKQDGAMRDAVRCPQCGSSRIEYPQFSRRTLMSALPAAAAAVGLVDREFYCEACSFTWPAEVKEEATRDVLGWEEGTKVP